MRCKRLVYEYRTVPNFRTFPTTFISKPVRYRDEHAEGCDGNCTPAEMPWPHDEPWPNALKQKRDDDEGQQEPDFP